MKRRRRVGPGSSIAGRGRTRVAIGIRSVFAVFSVCAVTIAAPGSHAFAGTTSPNTAHAGRGGGRFVIDSADLQYFVALNGNDTKDDAASGEDFPSFNRQIGSGAFSGPEGTASAKSKEIASVTDIVTGDFETATATAEISGSAHRA